MIASAVGSRVQSYVDDVLSGNITVCKSVRDAVQRYVDDRAKESTTEFPYHFNAHHATIACEFFPLVLRHSIGDYVGQPFELEGWQLFAIWNIFGWKRDSDNSRRFRRVYWSMGRKNGKSCIGAGIALFCGCLDTNPVTGKPENVAEIILSATKKEQAEKVIYAEIERMRLQSNDIENATDRINKQITFKDNHSSIRCVGSDRPYDGLNPHVVIMDELHAWKEQHRKFYDTITTGSGSRSQPLTITVTTAGDEKSLLWRNEYEYAKAVACGEHNDESLFAYCFELDENDDPLVEENWIKANPNIGVSVKIDYLREQAKKAAHSAYDLKPIQAVPLQSIGIQHIASVQHEGVGCVRGCSIRLVQGRRDWCRC